MCGSNFGGYSAYQQQPQQQYQSPAAQRAYQQLNAISGAGYPSYPMQQPAQSASPGITWVQGDAAARSFLVAPGATVLLMDSDSNRFYIKSADPSGMPNTRTFEYVEVDPSAASKQATPPDIDLTQYVTRREYDEMAQQFRELTEKLNKLLVNDTKRRKVVPDNEESVV